MIRQEVARVIAFAPLPPEDECSDELVMEIDLAMRSMPMSVTDEEADAILALLATPDESSYYGAMWTLIHAVESAPTIPPRMWTLAGPWLDRLRRRARKAGFEAPTGLSQ